MKLSDFCPGTVIVVRLEHRIRALAEYSIPSIFGKLNITEYLEIIIPVILFFKQIQESQGSFWEHLNSEIQNAWYIRTHSKKNEKGLIIRHWYM